MTERTITTHAETPAELLQSEMDDRPNAVRVSGYRTTRGMRLLIETTTPQVIFTAEGARELARVLLQAADRIDPCGSGPSPEF